MGAWGKGDGVAEVELALGKRWGLSRISGSLGAQSVLRLEAVRSSSGAPIALCSVLVLLTMEITTQLVLTHRIRLK